MYRLININSLRQDCQTISTVSTESNCKNDDYSHIITDVETETENLSHNVVDDVESENPSHDVVDDDEFGGGCFNVQRHLAGYGDADGDDEFGGGSFNVERYLAGYGGSSEDINTDGEGEGDTIVFAKPIAATKSLKVNQYLVEGTTKIHPADKPLCFPLVVDTEFYTQPTDYHQQRRKPLTIQMKGVDKDCPGLIYSLHPSVNVGRELANLEPFKKVETDFYLLDYIRDVGSVEVSIREMLPNEKRTPCYFVVYAHFATAEINLIAQGSLKEQIRFLQQSKGEEQIKATRRLYCQQLKNGTILDHVSLKHIVTIDGHEYELMFKIVDTGAIHGIAGYKDVAKAVGVDLEYKDIFTSQEKGRMLDMAVERPKDFENYALGDLHVYDLLVANEKQWLEVHKKLGLEQYYQIPKLTIGASVKTLFESVLAKHLNIEPDNWLFVFKKIVDTHIQPGSADELRKQSNFTRAILSKVEGGRCRNNRPTELSLKGKLNSTGLWNNPICDIDISGCYGEGQRNQDYPIGKPEIFDYKVSKYNQYIALREWLKAYEVQTDTLIKCVEDGDIEDWNKQENWGELVAGLWQARITTVEPLKYAQDYFASWFMETSHGVDMLAKTIEKMKCDSELLTTETVNFDEDTGNLKVFSNDIKNGVLTHDGLQWILSVCSKRQRKELLDNLYVVSSAVYPASYRIDAQGGKGLAALDEGEKNWDGRNTTQRIKDKNRATIVMNCQEYHGWFSVNLGELLIDKLLIERKKAQITDGKKSPLDTLFKLCVNTLYGDMVSKYFVTSNPVVGNNITARARALAWYMEKGLHGHQPITDGCAFELNSVLFAGRDSINGECVNIHRENSKLSQWMIKKGSLGGKKIECNWVDGKLQLIIEGEVIENPMQWIDNTAMIHLQNTFPLVDVLQRKSTSLTVDKETLETMRTPRKGQFSFETKDVYHSGCFHGSANYILENPNGTVVKARGYETKKEHTGIELDSEQDDVIFLRSDRYGVENNPAKDFLRQLLDNPTSIKRQIPAIKSGILKVGDYKNHPRKYDELGIEPGDNILKPVLMQEFSLSQFTFESYEQYMSWKKVIDRAKINQKQSLEGFFLNDDCTLNLQALCEWVDSAIAKGVMNPFNELKNKHRNDRRTEKTVKAQSRAKVKSGRPLETVVSIEHPHLDTLNRLKARLNTGD